MEEGRMSPEKRNLLIVLGALCSLAVVLAVLVVMNFVKQPKEVVEERDYGRPDISEMTEEDIAYYNYVDDFDEVERKVQELFGKNPVDVDAINAIYKERVDHYMSNDETDRAGSFILDWYNNYDSREMKQEALDVLTSVRLENLAPAEQYRYYTRLISLAKELGRDDLVKKYEPLQASTKEAYDLDYEDSLRAEAEAKALEDAAIGPIEEEEY